MATHVPFECLDEPTATERLRQYGRNELPQTEKENFWIRSSKILKEPMLLLLIAAGTIYLFMGDIREGLILGVSVFVVIGISIYQERKSEKALAALRELSSPRALVVRNGVEKRIAANLLVPGDLVILSEGDRVPADGLILQATNLSVDESLLTGESFPTKKSTVTSSPVPSFEDVANNFKVFSSTLAVSGTAFIRVLKTGMQTEVGKIGKSLQEAEPEELNLNKEIRQIVKLFAWSGALICTAIIILYGLSQGTWMQAFLVGLATQMALLPEEFPVVLTIFLAMGAWRLSKLQVLTRKPGAIERLGAVTVLCVDKTGTLTKNQMTVTGLQSPSGVCYLDAQSAKNLNESFHEVAEFAVLASHRDPFDPMEKAIRHLVEDYSWGKEHLHQDWSLVRDYPLSDQLLAMSCVWKKPDSGNYIIASKGAPEAVIDLCHLEKAETQKILAATKEMATRGLRVLGVAKATLNENTLPSDQHDFAFQWIGLIGLEDPLRPEVPAAIEQCRNAGIRVIMMTGDYPETALEIAKRAGLETSQALLTGAEVQELSDSELRERLQTAHIFARMVPAQKLRIVKLLKDLGHVVGMTGDGVNDAPSLKWADIGVAMGARGTDVAREASDIVLLDDNFASIVAGVERGRLIFSNIRKAMSYIASVHIPIAGLSIIPVLTQSPLILFPVHIVFLELIIDPACSLLFESQNSDKHLMNTPPRSLQDRLFSVKDMGISFIQGLLVLVIVMIVLWYDSTINKDAPDRARALAFVILAMSNVGLIFASISRGAPKQLLYLFKKPINGLIVIGLILVLFVVTQVSAVSSIFYFGHISIPEFFTALGIALFVFILISLWNRLFSRK